MIKKPVKPNTMCVIFGAKVPENNGKIVTTIKYLGDGRPYKYACNDLWEIDTLLASIGQCLGNINPPDYYCQESILYPIDDFNEIEQNTEELEYE